MRPLTFVTGGILVMLGAGCGGTRPDGVGKGSLIPCPSTPNCISTHASDSQHAMAALDFDGSASDALDRICAIIQALPRTKIITRTDAYMHAEFTSKFWRFVDDVEFAVDTANKQINFRSASRLGKSDLGVNRARMTEIVRQFKEHPTQDTRTESGETTD